MILKSHNLHWFVLLAIALSSFFLSALPFYPFLNSDIAIQVLQVVDFTFPDDLYFWGQDRLGSIVPLVGSMFHHWIGIDPLWAISISKWTFLLCGYGICTHWIRSRARRVILAFLWFFPPFEMMYWLLPAHPYAEQFTLVLAAVFYFEKMVSRRRWYFGVLAALCASLALWVSDFSLVIFGSAVCFVFLVPSLRKSVRESLGRHWVPARLVLIVGVALLLWLKTWVPGDPSYHDSPFANLEGVIQNLQVLWFYFLNAFTGNTVLPSSSWILWTYVALLAVMLLVRNALRFRILSTGMFFTAVLGFVVLICSDWVAANDTPIKYFIPVIFLLWLAVLTLDFSALNQWQKTLMLIAGMAVVVVQGLNLFQLYRYDLHHGYSLQELRAVTSHSPRHFMGDYWHSYVLCLAHPEQFIATPHDGATQRNSNWTNQVLRADTIGVVGNDWMESVPDTLIQFDRTLIRLEPSKHEGPFRIAPYRVVK